VEKEAKKAAKVAKFEAKKVRTTHQKGIECNRKPLLRLQEQNQKRQRRRRKTQRPRI